MSLCVHHKPEGASSQRFCHCCKWAIAFFFLLKGSSLMWYIIKYCPFCYFWGYSRWSDGNVDDGILIECRFVPRIAYNKPRCVHEIRESIPSFTVEYRSPMSAVRWNLQQSEHLVWCFWCLFLVCQWSSGIQRVWSWVTSSMGTFLLASTHLKPASPTTKSSKRVLLTFTIAALLFVSVNHCDPSVLFYSKVNIKSILPRQLSVAKGIALLWRALDWFARSESFLTTL